MKIIKKVEDYNIKRYEWDFSELGLFEATIKDGELTDLRFCMSGSSVDSGGLHTNDVEYLEAVSKALIELLPLVKK